MGVLSSPSLEGALDLNSLRGPVVSWLRSIDGINTHDASYELAAAGGVTTSLILPGSDNTIGKCPFNLSRPHHAEQFRRWRGLRYQAKADQREISHLTSGGASIRFEHLRHRLRHSSQVEAPQTRVRYVLSAVCRTLTDRLHLQVKTPVGTPEFGARRHLKRSRTAMTYSGTRMDNVWADRQAFVLSADIPVLAHFQYVGTTRRERSKELKTLTAKKPWLEDGRVSVNSRKI